MASYIHGQTDPREVSRLEKQAAWGAPFILRDFQASAGERVLDLATGVGAMADQLARRFPGIRLTGVDLKLAALRSAQARHPVAGYVNADGTRLPFRDATFDRLHCSWLLEHVPSPVAILREVHRVLRPGGTAQFIEVDNSTFRTRPEYPELKRVMAALNRAQLDGGGDPYVGKKLGGYFHDAGFTEVTLAPSVLHGTPRDRANFQGVIDEFAEIVESLDKALGATLGAAIPQAAEQLRGLLGIPDAELYYSGVIATARR